MAIPQQTIGILRIVYATFGVSVPDEKMMILVLNLVTTLGQVYLVMVIGCGILFQTTLYLQVGKLSFIFLGCGRFSLGAPSR